MKFEEFITQSEQCRGSSILSESISYTYKAPANVETRIYDFYILGLYYHELQGASGKNGTSKIQGMYRPGWDEDTLKDLIAIVHDGYEEIISVIKPDLLDALALSIASELRHAFDGAGSNENILKAAGTHSDAIKKFYRGYLKLSAVANAPKDLQRDKRTHQVGSSRKYTSAKQAFDNSGMTYGDLAQASAAIFNLSGIWLSMYGGKKWVAIANGLGQLYKSKGVNEDTLAIDHVIDLVHNTGSVLNKVKRYAGNDNYKWIEKALDLKKIASPWELALKSSLPKEIVGRLNRLTGADVGLDKAKIGKDKDIAKEKKFVNYTTAKRIIKKDFDKNAKSSKSIFLGRKPKGLSFLISNDGRYALVKHITSFTNSLGVDIHVGDVYKALEDIGIISMILQSYSNASVGYTNNKPYKFSPGHISTIAKIISSCKVQNNGKPFKLNIGVGVGSSFNVEGTSMSSIKSSIMDILKGKISTDNNEKDNPDLYKAVLDFFKDNGESGRRFINGLYNTDDTNTLIDQNGIMINWNAMKSNIKGIPYINDVFKKLGIARLYIREKENGISPNGSLILTGRTIVGKQLDSAIAVIDNSANKDNDHSDNGRFLLTLNGSKTFVLNGWTPEALKSSLIKAMNSKSSKNETAQSFGKIIVEDKESNASYKIKSLKAMSSEQFSAISNYMKAKGYDIRGGKDARDLLRKRLAAHYEPTPEEIEKYGSRVHARMAHEKTVDSGTVTEDWADAVKFALGKLKIKAMPSGARAMKSAIKQFGTTDNWSQAGYITPDGSILDLSGGGHNQRGFDHREVSGSVIPGDIGSEDAMNKFIEMGAIRIDINSGLIDIRREPTATQFSRLKDFITFRNNVIFMDVKSQTAKANEEYNKGTSPDFIINSIRSFFKTGKLKTMSIAQQFHATEARIMKEYYPKVDTIFISEPFKESLQETDAHTEDWLDRHGVERTSDGKVILYHGTKKLDAIRAEGVLRPSYGVGSMPYVYFETTPQDAYSWGKKTHGKGKVHVLKVAVDPSALLFGHFPMAPKEVPLEEIGPALDSKAMSKISKSRLDEATNDSNWLFNILNDNKLDPYHWSWLVSTWIEDNESDVAGEYGDPFETHYEDLNDKDQISFQNWLEDNVDKYASYDPITDQPNRVMNSIRHIKANEWLAHFSDDAEDIANNGFKYGSDYDGLHLTTYKSDDTRKSSGEWAFAFLADGRYAKYAAREKYGKHVVFFQSNAAILVNHDGDQEEQAVFQRTSAANRVYVYDDGDTWNVMSHKGTPVVRIKKFGDVIVWLDTNYNQYHKAIQVGDKSVAIDEVTSITQKRWWVNVSTGEIRSITVEHGYAVAADPKSFGLEGSDYGKKAIKIQGQLAKTPNDLDLNYAYRETAETLRMEAVMGGKWVRMLYTPQFRRINVESKNIIQARKAINISDKKDDIEAGALRGLLIEAVSRSISLDNTESIVRFLNGRPAAGPNQSKLAAFREASDQSSSAKLNVVHITTPENAEMIRKNGFSLEKFGATSRKVGIMDYFKREPKGIFLLPADGINRSYPPAHPYDHTKMGEYVFGTVSLKNPLRLDFDDVSWQEQLREMYDDKSGLRLTRAIQKDGHDGIIVSYAGNAMLIVVFNPKDINVAV